MLVVNHKYRVGSVLLILQICAFAALSSCASTNTSETNRFKDDARSRTNQRIACVAPFVNEIACNFESREWESFVAYIDRNRNLRRFRADESIYMSLIYDHEFIIELEVDSIDNSYITRLIYYQDVDETIALRPQVIGAAEHYMQVEGRVDSVGSVVWDNGVKKMVLYSQPCESPLNAAKVYDYCGYYEREYIVDD